MPDDLSDLQIVRARIPGRPLAGITILTVEDSRLASDAIRLLAVRAGARMRRADSVRAARRHIQTYRPSVVICDLGLPDGSGGDFIADLTISPYQPQAVIGMSGDPDRAAEALAAGADGFLLKPVESLAAFQAAVLAAMNAPDAAVAPGQDEKVAPDPLALRDDLSHAELVLRDEKDPGALDYVARFVQGVARVAHDHALERAAAELSEAARSGGDTVIGAHALAGIMRDRIAATAAF